MKNTKNRLEQIQNYLLILIVLASLLSFGSVQAAPAADDPLPTETVVSIEATTETTPTVVEPTLVVVEPTPTVVEPMPTVVEPSPTVVEPTPVVVEPTPIVVEPTPTVYAIISADAPAAPTPLTPSGSIATGNPTFTWTRPAGVTQYALYVNTNATPSVVKFANYVTPTCGASTCSFTPTLNLTAGSYKWRVRAGNADGWSLYSTWLNFTVSPPAAPTPLSPSGTITIGNPTYTWTRPAGVTKYALYVYTNATPSVMKFANYVTPACGASTCAYAPTLNLTAGNYKWAVKAGNTIGWSAYSTWLNFTVSSAGSGFDSQFNGSKTNWVRPTGDYTAWFVNSTYLYTAGTVNKISSVMYSQSGNEYFGTQTFTAKLVRYGCDYCVSGLIVRGEPGTLNSIREWANAYYFMYTRNGLYQVFKTVGGTETTLKGWTGSPQISQGTAWNILQVRASGSTLRFYINGCLVWTGTDTSFATGHAGIFMYRDLPTDFNTIYVDYATLTTTVNATTQFDTISAEQAALNAAADRQGSTGTSLMAPTPK